MAQSGIMEGTARQLRALRAALFTAMCVTLSTTSHVLLSRSPLPLATVAALGAAVFVIAYALAGRERRYWSIVCLLVPLELAADTVFTTGQNACYGQSGGPVAGFAARHGRGRAVRRRRPRRSPGPDGRPGGPGAQVPAAVNSATPWLLLAAHVVVGLLAAAWLRRGEAAFTRLLLAVAGFAFRPLLLAVAAVAPAVRPRPARPVRTARAPGPGAAPPCTPSYAVGRRARPPADPPGRGGTATHDDPRFRRRTPP
ncbi:hypothetical protein NKH77_14005 [Streptomyces sp. M19]